MKVDLAAIAEEVDTELFKSITPDFDGDPTIRELLDFLAYCNHTRSCICKQIGVPRGTMDGYYAGNAETPRRVYEILLRAAKMEYERRRRDVLFIL